ncbi:MAG: RNA methyltransferase [Marinilabiliales bacterium]|jgi:tRNA G18 (ribose-2'-O)-methylase SpoU|nr:MAG: RNA methyltransferase [Marinilabiliales bacterium]
MRKLKNAELNRLDIDGYKRAEKNPVVIVLDNIRSLNNIGSIFRTADAFRVEAIYLCGITAQPPHRDIHKTALGATDSVNWKYFKTTEEAISELKTKNYVIIALEQAEGSVMLNKFYPDPNQSYVVILGNEVHGIEQKIVDISDHCVEIPQFGTKHSLNVTVSNGIILWDILLKLNVL